MSVTRAGRRRSRRAVRRRVRDAGSSPAAARPRPACPARPRRSRATRSRPPCALEQDERRIDRRHLRLDQVDVADEARDPARIRLLVDLGRRRRPARARPWSITPMRSATVIASSWSCVTMTKVSPSRACSSISSNRVSSRSFRSSAASGSSSSSTRGRLASARASATRWRWPPESWSRLARAEAFELHQRQHLVDARRDLGLRQAVLLQAEGDVARDRQMREQRVALEHHVDRPPVRRHAGDVLAVEQDAALVGRLEAGEHAQQRGLAAAGRAEQREELALVDVERHAVDGGEAAEALGDAARSATSAAMRHAIIFGRGAKPARDRQC